MTKNIFLIWRKGQWTKLFFRKHCLKLGQCGWFCAFLLNQIKWTSYIRSYSFTINCFSRHYLIPLSSKWRNASLIFVIMHSSQKPSPYVSRTRLETRPFQLFIEKQNIVQSKASPSKEQKCSETSCKHLQFFIFNIQGHLIMITNLTKQDKTLLFIENPNRNAKVMAENRFSIPDRHAVVAKPLRGLFKVSMPYINLLSIQIPTPTYPSQIIKTIISHSMYSIISQQINFVLHPILYQKL